MIIESEYFIYKRLDWDSHNIGLETYELQLKQDLNAVIIKEIKSIWHNADLLYIKNYTKNRINSKLIGEETSAVLYDTNVSFILNLNDLTHFEIKDYSDSEFKVESKLDIELDGFLSFHDSRFTKDVQLKNSMKINVYLDWIRNSFDVENKKFLTFRKKNELLGFILYHVSEDSMSIELISVKNGYQNQKIGSILINRLKKINIDSKISTIFVGTQISNISAINFYIKNGFKVNQTIDIYHWWR